MTEEFFVPQRRGRMIVQGATFTETLVLTIVNQLLQIPSAEISNVMPQINTILLANLIGEIELDTTYETEYLNILKKIFSQRYSQIPFPENIRIFSLREDLFKYLMENASKIKGLAKIYDEVSLQKEVMREVDEMIFVSTIVFFKKTGGLRDAVPIT